MPSSLLVCKRGCGTIWMNRTDPPAALDIYAVQSVAMHMSPGTLLLSIPARGR